jgi:hypothetical protein
MKINQIILLALAVVMAPACKSSTCVQAQPESLREVWMRRDPAALNDFRSLRYMMLSNPNSGGHFTLSDVNQKACPNSHQDVNVTNDLLLRARNASAAKPSDGPSCQMLYELDRGRWSEALRYVNLVQNTGANVVSVSPTRFGEADTSVYIEVEAYETCTDLELAMQFAFDGHTKVQKENVEFNGITNSLALP